jgi:hypothetical protein
VKRRKLTRAEREERDAEHARILANAQRTRELAEQAQAKLEGRDPNGLPRSTPFKLNPTRAEREAERARMLANAQRTRELAERAQAKLDAQRSSE